VIRAWLLAEKVHSHLTPMRARDHMRTPWAILCKRKKTTEYGVRSTYLLYLSACSALFKSVPGGGVTTTRPFSIFVPSIHSGSINHRKIKTFRETPKGPLASESFINTFMPSRYLRRPVLFPCLPILWSVPTAIVQLLFLEPCSFPAHAHHGYCFQLLIRPLPATPGRSGATSALRSRPSHQLSSSRSSF
jgi:hypothetical protein